MDQGTLQGIGTVLAMLAFLGICWWAFSSHKKQDFDEASQLPFVGQDPKGSTDETSMSSEEKRQN
jgi:cytochrome c oxidase cbb3-type subunit 4